MGLRCLLGGVLGGFISGTIGLYPPETQERPEDPIDEVIQETEAWWEDELDNIGKTDIK